jgi:hypothetical protein
MPLASNAAVSMKAMNVPKPPDHPKNAILAANGTTTNQRRDSISSLNSSHHPHLEKKRLSLPKSVPSTTVVTKTNVDRRRSLRRSIQTKENETHPTDAVETPSKKRKYDDNDEAVKRKQENAEYSPPETRSASQKKKKKQHIPTAVRQINPDFFHEANRNNALLQFSPPNQERNAQQELERIRQKEEARCVCVWVSLTLVLGVSIEHLTDRSFHTLRLCFHF